MIGCLVFITMFFGCKNHTQEEKEIVRKINAIYADKTDVYSRNIDSELYSDSLIMLLNKVIAATRADEERIRLSDHPTDKPILLEGSIFSSLYDGYSGYNIRELKINGENANIIMDFEYDGIKKKSWTDTVILIKRNGWKLENVLFNREYTLDKDLKDRLNKVLAGY